MKHVFSRLLSTVVAISMICSSVPVQAFDGEDILVQDMERVHIDESSGAITDEIVVSDEADQEFAATEEVFMDSSSELYYRVTSDTTVEVAYAVEPSKYDLTTPLDELPRWLNPNEYGNNKLTVPETVSYNGKSYTITGVGDLAFANYEYEPGSPDTEVFDYRYGVNMQIAEVKLPETIKRIGKGAFYRNSRMVSVNIPSSVTEIDEAAFYAEYFDHEIADGLEVTGLSSAKNLKTIGAFAFNGVCFLRTNVLTLPSGLTSIGKYAFGDRDASIDTNVGTIIIPESVKEIWQGAFEIKNLTQAVFYTNESFKGNAITYVNIFDGKNTQDKTSVGGNITAFIKDASEAEYFKARFGGKITVKALSEYEGGSITKSPIRLFRGDESIGSDYSLEVYAKYEPEVITVKVIDDAYSLKDVKVKVEVDKEYLLEGASCEDYLTIKANGENYAIEAQKYTGKAYLSFYIDELEPVKVTAIVFGYGTAKDGDIKIPELEKLTAGEREKLCNTDSIHVYDLDSVAPIKEKALEIVKEAGAKTDYEKALAVHIWLSNNIAYDYDNYFGNEYAEPVHDAYECLVQRKGVCGNFADLFEAMMTVLGIPCAQVVGYSGCYKSDAETIEDHAWNAVYIDGRWILCDATWDCVDAISKGKREYGTPHKDATTLEYFDYLNAELMLFERTNVRTSTQYRIYGGFYNTRVENKGDGRYYIGHKLTADDIIVYLENRYWFNGVGIKETTILKADEYEIANQYVLWLGETDKPFILTDNPEESIGDVHPGHITLVGIAKEACLYVKLKDDAPKAKVGSTFTRNNLYVKPYYFGVENYENEPFWSLDILASSEFTMTLNGKEVESFTIEEGKTYKPVITYNDPYMEEPVSKEFLVYGDGQDIPDDPIKPDDPDNPEDPDKPEEAGIRIGGLNASGYSYTGAAIKPEITVYDGDALLKKDVDYTVSYKNNIAANSLAPTITVKLKGNYSGTLTETFKINPVELGTIKADAVYLQAKKSKKGDYSAQKAVPSIWYLGKKLSENKDYVIEGNRSFAEPGEYSVAIKAKSTNFTGSMTVKVVVYDKAAARTYTSIADKKVTATLAAKAVTLGTANKLTVKSPEGNVLTEGVEYETTLVGADAVGTATYLITGRPEKGYVGQRIVTYKVNAIPAKDLTVSVTTAVMAKGGAKPSVTVTYNMGEGVVTLSEGTDYKLAYTGNTAVTKKGTVKITGLGNYKGTKSEQFTIEKQDVGELSIFVENVAYSKKAGAYKKAKVIVRDLDGKDLKANSDYTVEFSPADGSSAPASGTVVNVTVLGKGSYQGRVETTMTISDPTISIAKAKIAFYDETGAKVSSFAYTGSAVEPKNIKLTIGSGKKAKELSPDLYEIVGYANNTAKGKATVTVKGKNGCGGLVNYTFTIGSKASPAK